ncbi:uncharacterized protein [Callorhinus ursinus]|uniref:uncharacterized protein n=1 Tax=Callorhinus ursinus TaxID=34884 RepID=UPI003CD05260
MPGWCSTLPPGDSGSGDQGQASQHEGSLRRSGGNGRAGAPGRTRGRSPGPAPSPGPDAGPFPRRGRTHDGAAVAGRRLRVLAAHEEPVALLLELLRARALFGASAAGAQPRAALLLLLALHGAARHSLGFAPRLRVWPALRPQPEPTARAPDPLGPGPAIRHRNFRPRGAGTAGRADAQWAGTRMRLTGRGGGVGERVGERVGEGGGARWEHTLEAKRPATSKSGAAPGPRPDSSPLHPAEAPPCARTWRLHAGCGPVRPGAAGPPSWLQRGGAVGARGPPGAAGSLRPMIGRGGRSVGRTTPVVRVSVTALPQAPRGVTAAIEGRAEKHVTRNELERPRAWKLVAVPQGCGPLTMWRQQYGHGLWGRSCALTCCPALVPARPFLRTPLQAKKCRTQAA